MLGACATLFRKLFPKAKDDSGQTVLIVAGVLTGIALTALALFLNLDAGKRILNRLKSGSSSQVTAQQAVLAYYYQQITSTNKVGVLPCPDTSTSPTGVQTDTDSSGASGTHYCDGTSGHPNAGVLPWKDLGLSRDQALDGNGNFLTYVVAPTLSAKKICDTVTTNYDSGSEVTGTVADSSLRVTAADGTTSDASFAIIGHGSNALGALTSANKTTAVPTSTTEKANCDPALGSSCNAHSYLMGTAASDNGVLIAGPFKGSQGDNAFDDQVYTPSTSSLEKVCQTLTPGGALNATLTDNFAPVASANDANSDGLDDRKYSAETHGVTTASDADGRYAKFTNGGAVGAALITNKDNYNTDPRVRPVYTSLIWTPDITNVGTGGISIATRVTGADQTSSSDVFGALGAHGVTVRFYSTGTVGGTNKITIVESDGTSTTTSGDSSTDTYSLLSGEPYLVESYDDGSHVWGRITQINNYANTATVHATTSNDLTGNNQVAIIGGANTNRVANLSIGYGMVAFNTNGTGYVTRSSNLGLTSSFTAEAWIRPRVLPTSSTVPGVILGSWDPALVTTNNNPSGRNSFRLYITSDEKVGLELSTSGHNTESVTTNLNLTVGEWTHVAATFDASTKTVTFYGNGVAIGSGTVSTGTLNGVTPAEFTVGANAASTATPQNYFNGDISDVRIWTGARSASNISSYYRKRLSYATGTGIVTDSSPAATLLLNWKLDVDGFNGPTHVLTSPGSGTTANAAYSTGTALTSGSLVAGGTGYASSTGGAAYAGALANYYRPFAGDTVDSSGNTVFGVCQGYVAHTYECDYRTAGTYHPYSVATGSSVFPANLNAVHAKVIGGGGGGFDNTNVAAGGGGGYSAAQLAQINSTRLSGTGVDIIVGDNGTGSSTFTAGTGTVPGSPGYGNGAGGGGASSIRLTSGTVHGLAAGGGGGAGFSNNYLLGSAGCITLSSDPGNKCGLGGPGGGAGLTTPQAKDAGSTLCGGRGGSSTSPSGTNPANSFYCALGGADPGYVGSTLTNALTYGGSGGGTASGGTSAAGGGGAGYDAGSTAAGVGAGGGGGGVSNSGGTAGGGEAGGYEFFVYDTITIGGMATATTGDTVKAIFTNGSTLTASYPVTDASQGSQAARQAAIATGLTTQINALGSNISASSSGSVITVFQQGASSANTIMSATVTPATSNETVTLSGASNAFCKTGSFGSGTPGTGSSTTAYCDITIGSLTSFSAHTGDTITFTLQNTSGSGGSHLQCSFSSATQYTYTLTANYSDATSLATDLTTAFNSATDSQRGRLTFPDGTCTVRIVQTGAIVTLKVTAPGAPDAKADSTTLTNLNKTYAGGSSTTATATANCYSASSSNRMIPVGSSTCGTTSGSSSNGLGGGGGGGYADSNAASLAAQTGLSVATATIGGTTFQANDTVTITLTNSAIATASGIAAWGTGISETVTVTSDDVSSSSPLSAIASKLAAKINGDSTNQLQTYGISAFSNGAVVKIAQYGSYSVTTTLTSSVSHPGTGNETVTFSPTSGYMASGSAGGSTDFYYSPSSFTSGLNPGRGGAYQSTTGNAVNGNDGAILLFW